MTGVRIPPHSRHVNTAFHHVIQPEKNLTENSLSRTQEAAAPIPRCSVACVPVVAWSPGGLFPTWPLKGWESLTAPGRGPQASEGSGLEPLLWRTNHPQAADSQQDGGQPARVNLPISTP